MASYVSNKPALSRILRSPLVVVPAVAGTAAGALALLQGPATAVFSLVAVAGLFFASGSAVTQLVLGKRRGASPGREQSLKTASRDHESYLTDLLRRLLRDRDDRTEEILDRLHRVNDRLEIDGLLDGDEVPAPGIQEKVGHLYQLCLRSLERSWDFWRAAMEMSTDAVRKEMLDRREHVLEEVQESTAHLEAAVDYLRAKQVERGLDETEVTQIRDELDVGLQVARRVEEHMSELENELTARPQRAME